MFKFLCSYHLFQFREHVNVNYKLYARWLGVNVTSPNANLQEVDGEISNLFKDIKNKRFDACFF